ncbi:TetR/AcrR family transcriptional regulator [Massilia sp. DJPM01]|uniref:TetR/AcrR family transcriptional regulator n=1 Tax=Massilia sp. DJPM01 TaxID=3024404 RepID=UPI00259F71B5|nr:TetR/AcrR family transcriptional regulator [Massilia sp. DJPM01]MDM5176116.1 TetR/AcrR family transcriptional regulator [Massilia sp. DJPM01]
MVKATSSVQDRKLRESEQRRKDIIKAVRKLIKAGGARAITLRKVAEEAGFSTTVVYALFEDKATLITQAMDSDLLNLAKAMRAATDPALPPIDNIKRAGRAYVKFGMLHPDQYALVFLERRPHAPVESAKIEHGNQTQDPYAFGHQLFATLAASGQVRADRLDSMGQIFWEGIHGMTSLRLVFGESEQWFEHAAFDQHLEDLLDVLMTGILHRFRV